MSLNPDGIRKVFALPTLKKKVHQVLVYNNKTKEYTNAKFTFDPIKNEVILEEAPSKECVLLISSI